MAAKKKKTVPKSPLDYVQGTATRDELLAWAYQRTDILPKDLLARRILDACMGEWRDRDMVVPWSRDTIVAACRRYLASQK